MKDLFIPTKKNHYKPYLLRKALLVFYAIILVVVNTFGGLFGITQISASNVNSSTLISLTNRERSIAGLNTLNTNSKLTAAAKAKAENMFEEQYWDHFGPNGETPWQFITAAGYNYVYAGENLAKGFKTSEGVVEAWMASPAHRDNILSKNYKDIGIYVKTGVLLGKQTTLVVQMFGNLTTDVYSGTTSKPSTEIPTIKSPVIETGQIKAISITQPKSGDVLRDPTILIKGSVEGDDQDYTVELYDLDSKIGTTEDDDNKWEYSSKESWEDGKHNLEAKVKGTSIVSKAVGFTVDTKAPNIIRESLEIVRSDDNFVLSFNTDEAWYELTVINGDQEITFLSAEGEDIVLKDFEPADKVVLSVSDQAGNKTEIDISEYFLEGQTDDYNNFNFSLLVNSLKSSQGINITVVAFILILLLVEIYILWKKGKLSRNLGDLFVIALWITILTIGIFKGFGGISS